MEAKDLKFRWDTSYWPRGGFDDIGYKTQSAPIRSCKLGIAKLPV
jgi:hypothetical protein